MEPTWLTVMAEPLVVVIVGKVRGVYEALRWGLTVIWLQYAESMNHSKKIPGVTESVELDALKEEGITWLKRVCSSAMLKVGIFKEIESVDATSNGGTCSEAAKAVERWRMCTRMRHWSIVWPWFLQKVEIRSEFFWLDLLLSWPLGEAVAVRANWSWIGMNRVRLRKAMRLQASFPTDQFIDGLINSGQRRTIK